MAFWQTISRTTKGFNSPQKAGARKGGYPSCQLPKAGRTLQYNPQAKTLSITQWTLSNSCLKSLR